MSAVASEFIFLAELKARHNLETNPTIIRDTVLAAIQREAERKKRLSVYMSNIDAHKAKDNFRNAVVSKGCGCILCSTRHTYAKLKAERKAFQKAYDAKHSYDHLFRKLYDTHGGVLSQREFFTSRMNMYNHKIKDLKAQLTAIQETINSYYEK